MSTKFIFWGIVLAGLAVLLGAFGAHILSPIFAEMQPEPNAPPPMDAFRSAVQFHIFHALALILTGLLYRHKGTRHVKNAGILFLIGIILFCGSLYFITIGHVLHRSFKFVGPITPLGGISFLVGWILLAISFHKK
jgi:uncharacterized membrane protein YgdD (TMEM256/DUF423 family)